MNVTNSSAAWDGAEWNWGHYIVDIAALSVVAVYSIVYFGSDIGRWVYFNFFGGHNVTHDGNFLTPITYGVRMHTICWAMLHS